MNVYIFQDFPTCKFFFHHIFLTICTYLPLVAGRSQWKRTFNPKTFSTAKSFMAIDHNNKKKKVPMPNLELVIIFKSKKLQKTLKFFKFILKKWKWPFTLSSGTRMTNLLVEIDEQEIFFMFGNIRICKWLKLFFLKTYISSVHFCKRWNFKF